MSVRSCWIRRRHGGEDWWSGQEGSGGICGSLEKEEMGERERGMIAGCGFDNWDRKYGLELVGAMRSL